MSIGPLHVDTRKLGSTAFDGPYIVGTINKAEFRFVHKLNTKKTLTTFHRRQPSITILLNGVTLKK